MRFFSKKLNKSSRGFTLVETLVAISIFTVSLLGITSVLAGSLSHTSYVKQKMTAIYLAQEGIEYMRNMRDTHVLYDSDSDFSVFSSVFNPNPPIGCVQSSPCGFISSPPPPPYLLAKCSQASGCKLNVDNGNYYLANPPDGGSDSGFTRKIWGRKVGSGQDEVKIFSKVLWKQGSGEYSVTFSENLFDWIDK